MAPLCSFLVSHGAMGIHGPYHIFRYFIWFTLLYSYWTNNFLLSDIKHGFCAAVMAIYLWLKDLKDMGLSEHVVNTTKFPWCLSWRSSCLNEIDGHFQEQVMRPGESHGSLPVHGRAMNWRVAAEIPTNKSDGWGVPPWNMKPQATVCQWPECPTDLTWTSMEFSHHLTESQQW